MKAIQSGAVKDIVHLDQIADYIIDFSKGKKKIKSFFLFYNILVLKTIIFKLILICFLIQLHFIN